MYPDWPVSFSFGCFHLGSCLNLTCHGALFAPRGNVWHGTWEPGTWLMHGWREPGEGKDLMSA